MSRFNDIISHMAFTKKDIEKLAQLARIQLTETEKEKFCQQISSILDYVGQVEEVDTSSVRAADYHGAVKNVWRDDVFVSWQKIRPIIDQYPEKYGNLNKVKPVFE
jgi:aspartyl-tRNA(Asn)/glutamyl-tRNA(Gln) amidotransferase subunit C